MKTQRTKIKIAILSLGAFSLLLLFGLESCRKYEEGPTISFRSRYSRFTNIWLFEKILVNGVDISIAYLSDSNNVYKLAIKYDDQRSEFYGVGKDRHDEWIDYGFRELKKYKVFRVRSSCSKFGCTMLHNGAQPEESEWEIIKLKEDELAFKTLYNGDEYKMYLKPWTP